ncbi:telomere-associated protein 1 [Cladobotryum mycophilum]|uniref:Telomere-associated protein 1 n=1 Tax=Cladobotryum mycophilum TaxID=491253 RepID=A0ABR0T3N9_9HYPO
MATIEPRLIHLLNESTTPQLSNNDLPPLHSLPLPESPSRPLPPLDPEGSHRGDRHHGGRAAPPGGPTSGSISVPYAGDEATYAIHRKEDDRREGRYAGSSGAYPMRLLLGEGDVTTTTTNTMAAAAAAAEHSYSFANILDDGQDLLDDASTKKRGRAINVKDDFVQLPQPVKKQKAAQQAHPPPHAALFPPMASNSFDESDSNQMKLLHDFNHSPDDKSSQRPPSESDGKARKRATKPRRKWSDEETNHLLLGVNRHGVGKWTNILEDPDFRFNGRTAGDLKDRFRTCCPDELRGNKREGRHESGSSSRQKAKKGIYSENILIDEDELSSKEPTASPKGGDSDSAPKKKSRAHRKKMEDLAELGIHGPFKKSHRRERRPFTEQDDREILEGLEFYGPAWTKIQRDTRFHLASRQPTDLRDRVRNKYPVIYQRIEKGTFQVKDARGNPILEPSINMTIDGSYKTSKTTPMDQHVSHRGSREDLPRWPFQVMEPADFAQPQQQAYDFGEPSAPPMIVGEMDISRLLLDDSKLGQASTRSGYNETSSTSSPTGNPYDSRRR